MSYVFSDCKSADGHNVMNKQTVVPLFLWKGSWFQVFFVYLQRVYDRMPLAAISVVSVRACRH
jgi:hypothetical protein